MLDSFQQSRKKEYERKVIEYLIGRCYPLDEVSSQRKKMAIQDEAEVFYRDHIQGMLGKDSSHHVNKRFEVLNEKIQNELSVFAEKIHEAGDDLVRIEDVFKAYGQTISFSGDKLKSMMKNN